jgi:hypothetical protein
MTNTHTDFTKGFELALERAGHRFPRLSRLRAKADPRYSLHIEAPELKAPSFFLLDVTLARGLVRLIEANGSNGALSSTIALGDQLRARHMAFAFATKPRPAGSVVAILCHQAGFLHLGEFFVRAELFKAELAQRHVSRLRGAGEELGEEEVSVVCGSTAEIANLLESNGGKLFYKGRPVVFASNPNVLPEAARRGLIQNSDGFYDIAVDIFHEGASTPVIHDKALQQQLAGGTGIQPLEWRLVEDSGGWLAAVDWFQRRGMPCVAKMHAGSGGAGIEIVTPEMKEDEALAVLDRLLDSARNAYGDKVEATAFPIALFEFAKADPVELEGHPHLWDLRVAAFVEPGGVDCHACVGRLCPSPFDGSWKRDTWVSNLSGRDGNRADHFLRAPAELGLADNDLDRILEATANWAVAAARWGEGVKRASIKQ